MHARDPAALIPALLQQAESHHRAGRLAEAEQFLTYLLAAAPNHADALHLLGAIALQRGKPGEAAELIGRAIRLRGSVPFYHGNLGIALRLLNRLEEAVPCFRKALSLKPDFVEMRNELAIALCNLGQNEAAVPHFRQVLQQRPALAGVWENLAIALRNLKRWDEAAVAFDHAAALEPGRAELLFYAGAVRMPLGRAEEAEALYRRAIALRPEFPEARHSLAAKMLLMGQFTEAWPEFEWRWHLPGVKPRSFAQPRWTGEDLAGRTLLLYAEQGFGDTIQFCRYACLFGPEADIILEAPPPLVPLLQTLPGTRRVVPVGAALPPFDLQCPLLSLPGAFGTTVETIPSQTPYLRATEAAVSRWRSRLAGLKRPWVGIAWAGNPEYSQDAERSLPFTRLASLLRQSEASFVSLQKDRHDPPSPGDAGLLHDWTDELADFADTAGLIEALDLVISVDTAVVHLAGALGRPTWLLNRFNTEWRWLQQRDDSPWYPTLRQFRQPRLGDWDSVLAAVADEISLLGRGAAPQS